ncbi:hypothetical protein P20495_2337 [Pseudoalteromonas sp. BSi20495]|nr:hypothetical protein P20495_2337 [Pseudoalteromonas sp. BSi20495]
MMSLFVFHYIGNKKAPTYCRRFALVALNNASNWGRSHF